MSEKVHFYLPICLICAQNVSYEKLGWTQEEGEVKLDGRSSNNLRYADNTILLAESNNDLK